MKLRVLTLVLAVGSMVACGGSVAEDGGTRPDGSGGSGAGTIGPGGSGAGPIGQGGSGPIGKGGFGASPPAECNVDGDCGMPKCGTCKDGRKSCGTPHCDLGQCVFTSDPPCAPTTCDQVPECGPCPDDANQVCFQGACRLLTNTSCGGSPICQGVADCTVCTDSGSDVCFKGECLPVGQTSCAVNPCAAGTECGLCDPCPDGDCVGGISVCQKGQCIPYPKSICEVPGFCRVDSDCPVPDCAPCPGGGEECPAVFCDASTSRCITEGVGGCPPPVQCQTPADCVTVVPCEQCDNGSMFCPKVDCQNGQCVDVDPNGCPPSACLGAPCGTPCKTLNSPSGVGQCFQDQCVVAKDGLCGTDPCAGVTCPGSCTTCPDGSTTCSSGVCDPMTGMCTEPPPVGCPMPKSPCAGLKCGDVCNPCTDTNGTCGCPPGADCDPPIGFCDIKGFCETMPTSCTF